MFIVFMSFPLRSMFRRIKRALILLFPQRSWRTRLSYVNHWCRTKGFPVKHRRLTVKHRQVKATLTLVVPTAFLICRNRTNKTTKLLLSSYKYCWICIQILLYFHIPVKQLPPYYIWLVVVGFWRCIPFYRERFSSSHGYTCPSASVCSCTHEHVHPVYTQTCGFAITGRSQWRPLDFCLFWDLLK